MSNFPAPNDRAIEDALARMIQLQLSLHGIDVDATALNRIRQQLPVSGWLDGIVEAGRRDRGDEPVVVDVETKVVFDSQAAADAVTEPEVAAEANAMPDHGEVEVAMAQGTDNTGGGESVVPDPPAAPAVPVHKPAYRLLVPNATADKGYDHSLDLSGEQLAPYRIASIDGLEEIGLAFDPDANRLYGTPQPGSAKSVPHELAMVLERKDDTSIQAPATLSLFINPHPRTLWKNIEPGAALEFRKEHRRSLFEAGPPMVLAASVRGRSHENSGAFREDDFHVGHDASGKWTVVAVSDGAGSAKLSRLGSEIATRTSVDILLAELEGVEDEIVSALTAVMALNDATARDAKLEDVRRNLFLGPVGKAAFQASRAIRDKAADLCEEEKALAATLMFTALRRFGDEVLVASYWIGDGAAVLLDSESGYFQLLGEADSGEFSGQTRFLLSSEFSKDTPWDSISKRFRFHLAPVGATLMLMTDGVSDPKFGTDNALRDPARWLSFWNDDLVVELQLTEPTPELAGKLEDYLQFWSKGEHDDRTLAMVYWP